MRPSFIFLGISGQVRDLRPSDERGNLNDVHDRLAKTKKQLRLPQKQKKGRRAKKKKKKVTKD